MTTKLLGTLARYGWKSGVHKNQQFGMVNTARTAAGLGQDPLTKWEFFVVTAAETWGASTKYEANLLWKTMQQQESAAMKTFQQFVAEGFMGEVLWTGTVKELEAEARKKGFRIKWEKGYGLGKGNIQPDKKVELIGDPDDRERLEVYSTDTQGVFLGRAYDSKFYRESLNEDTAYKGYLIRTNPLNGLVWIEKDGHRISGAKDVEDAKQTINMLTEDEGAGAPANSAGFGNIAGLGVGKAGKPANWGEPSPRKRRMDEGDKVLDTAIRKGHPVVDGSTREMPVYHPEPDYNSQTDDELDVWLRKQGMPTAQDWAGASQPETPMEGRSDSDYSNDTLVELMAEGLVQSSKPNDTFAGAAVFEVDMDTVHKSRFGKNRYHRYSRYVGENEVGEQIRQHGRDRKSGDIILKDKTTSVMTYLRRKPPVN